MIHKRAKFHILCQRQGESVEEFVRNLHELAAHCEFRDKDDQIRDRLVVGILDNDLSEKLQLESELTLVKAVDMARNSELVKNQIKDLQSKNLDAVKVRQYGLGGKQYGHRKPPQAKPKDTTYDECGSCKLRHCPGNCPAVGRICLKCGNKGHFKAACRGRPKRLAEVQDDEDEDATDDSFYMGSIDLSNSDNTDAWTVKLKVCRKLITFKIDTGADTSVITEATYNSLPVKPKLQEPKNKLYSPGGTVQCK